jgi:hypothetical protein
MKDNFLTISDAIAKLMANHPSKDKLMASAIINAWKKTAPQIIQDNVRKIFVKENFLYINIESSIIRHTVKLNKSRILEEMNLVNASYKVQDIVLI